MRQILRHLKQGGFQPRCIGAVPIGNGSVLGLVRGHQNEGIVGRGIPIHRNAVERLIGELAAQWLYQIRSQTGICGHETEHGGHIGANHACPFCHACDSDGLTANHYLTADGFGLGIGGHDGLRRLQPMVGLGIGQCHRQTSHHTFGWQLLHDHASGERQHLFATYTQLGSQRLAHALCTQQALGSGTRIGIAGVDDQRTRTCSTRGRKMLTTNLNWRSTKPVLREHGPHGCAFIQ